MNAITTWFKRRIYEYQYPFKTPLIRIGIHLGFAFFIPLFFLPNGGWRVYFGLAYWIFSMDFLQGIGHVYIYWRLNERYDWIKDTKKRVLYGIIGHTGITLVLFFVVGVVNGQLLWGSSFEEAVNTLLTVWFVPLIIVASVLSFSVAGEFLKNWKASVVNAEKLKSEMMAYKYESLRSQMNPHFLFNSFNVLTNLVNQDPKLAIQFIHKLSELYRNVLETRDKELVSLHEELKFIESYIFLLKIRFEDKLHVNIDVQATSNDLVVPMVLQSLIENVVKHNAISRAEPIEINIIRNNGSIEVSNPIRPKSIRDEDKSGTGLQNIKQRYKFFTDKDVEIIKNDGKFTVTIPVLKQE